MEKFNQIQKEFQILNPLYINVSGKKGISYKWKIDDWKTFEKNIQAIALNILYISEKERCPVYISKINSNCENK